MASKALKLAARHGGDQGKVWSEVQQAQDKLSATVGRSVRAPASASSLQLTLENGQVALAVGRYARALSGVVEGKADAIGYVFAVNGQLNSAEVYASRALFRTLWPRLLKASAVEAVAELQKGKAHAAVGRQAVRAFLADAETGRPSEQELTAGNRSVKRESEKALLFETRDRKEKDSWIHRSYVAK